MQFILGLTLTMIVLSTPTLKLYKDLSSRRKMFYEPRVVHTTMFGATSGDNEYFMNSLWHRTIDGKELNEYDDDYTLAVGCSHTFGSGCSKPWPWYIENCYNAGIPGASIHDMADVAFAIHKDVIMSCYIYNIRKMPNDKR